MVWMEVIQKGRGLGGGGVTTMKKINRRWKSSCEIFSLPWGLSPVGAYDLTLGQFINAVLSDERCAPSAF